MVVCLFDSIENYSIHIFYKQLHFSGLSLRFLEDLEVRSKSSDQEESFKHVFADRGSSIAQFQDHFRKYLSKAQIENEVTYKK